MDYPQAICSGLKVQRGWPLDPLERFAWIYEHASDHHNYDFVFSMDAD